jgi:signal transduction histidine kinase
MDEETKKRVFEPFFTTKPPGQGTGLGLSVSYFIIATHHNGRLLAKSDPGKGAAFSIEIPLSQEVAGDIVS